ncbi:MAG: DUF1045 domain-containing protein [Pseudomonadota bacterium]
MSNFRRYAIYYLPDDAALAAFGAHWLGWDVTRAASANQPETDVPLREFTENPRKYGFHGTLKPPFFLADGRSADDLVAAVEALAASVPAFEVAGLEVAELGSLLALIPTEKSEALSNLAARLVQELDAFRAPPNEAELQRRRMAGLTQNQEEMLTTWGYPYVLDEFRFHLTLTGALGHADLELAKDVARRQLPPLPRPFPIQSVWLAGELEDGMFVALRRFALSG